jgi:hypothetical protein
VVLAAALCSSVAVLEVRLAFLSGFCAQEAANAAAIAATIKRFVLMTSSPSDWEKNSRTSSGTQEARR